MLLALCIVSEETAALTDSYFITDPDCLEIQEMCSDISTAYPSRIPSPKDTAAEPVQPVIVCQHGHSQTPVSDQPARSADPPVVAKVLTRGIRGSPQLALPRLPEAQVVTFAMPTLSTTAQPSSVELEGATPHLPLLVSSPIDVGQAYSETCERKRKKAVIATRKVTFQVNELVTILSEKPHLRAEIKSVLQRHDLSESEKMLSIELIVRRAPGEA